MNTITAEQTTKIGERLIDGIETVGFEVPMNIGLAGPGAGSYVTGDDKYTARIWVTRDAAVPILVELEKQVFLSSGGPPHSVEGTLLLKSTINNIQWNIPLADKIFKFPDLQGWKFGESRSKMVEFSRTKFKRNLTISVGPKDGPPILTEKDFKKRILAGTMSEETENGKTTGTVKIMLNLTDTGQEKLRSFVSAHPRQRLMVDFDKELQHEVEIRMSERDGFFIRFFDDTGKCTQATNTGWQTFVIDITSLGKTLEEFESEYLTSEK